MIYDYDVSGMLLATRECHSTAQTVSVATYDQENN